MGLQGTGHLQVGAAVVDFLDGAEVGRGYDDIAVGGDEVAAAVVAVDATVGHGVVERVGSDGDVWVGPAEQAEQRGRDVVLAEGAVVDHAGRDGAVGGIDDEGYTAAQVGGVEAGVAEVAVAVVGGDYECGGAEPGPRGGEAEEVAQGLVGVFKAALGRAPGVDEG